MRENFRKNIPKIILAMAILAIVYIFGVNIFGTAHPGRYKATTEKSTSIDTGEVQSKKDTQEQTTKQVEPDTQGEEESNPIDNVQLKKPHISFSWLGKIVDKVPPFDIDGITGTVIKESPTSTETQATSETQDTQSSTEQVLPEGVEAYKVEKIVDGDTIAIIYNGQYKRVRLIGVNTPESVSPDVSQNCEEGSLASEHTKELVHEGDTVYLVADAGDTDKYNRPLRYVYLECPKDFTEEEAERIMLNAIIVKDGYAEPMMIEPNTKYADLFQRLYDDAVLNQRGLYKQQH